MNARTKNPKNKPGKPIVTREEGATFYCLACHKTYQKCKCRIYVSADTLRRAKSMLSVRDSVIPDND